MFKPLGHDNWNALFVQNAEHRILVLCKHGAQPRVLHTLLRKERGIDKRLRFPLRRLREFKAVETVHWECGDAFLFFSSRDFLNCFGHALLFFDDIRIFARRDRLFLFRFGNCFVEDIKEAVAPRVQNPRHGGSTGNKIAGRRPHLNLKILYRAVLFQFIYKALPLQGICIQSKIRLRAPQDRRLLIPHP